MGAQGHVSVRSQRDPNHYYIARYVFAGIVGVSDIIENDSTAVRSAARDRISSRKCTFMVRATRPGPTSWRSSTLTHQKSRPSLRARFCCGRCRTGGRFIGSGLPIFDIRQFHPRPSIIDSPELGKALVGVLGKSPAVTITDSSVYGLVSRAYNLRVNAIIQQQAISLGGSITYLDGQAATGQPQPVVPTGDGGGRGADRT